MADTRVVPVGNVKYGLKAETTFGNALDDSGADGTAYLTQPVIQAQKPVFNILRESRLLSGRGLMKHKSDTIINTKGGTVTMPFDMVATPRTLGQHLTLVGQNPSTSGTTIHIQTFTGDGNPASIGEAISGDGIPHSCNLAWYPAASEGIRVAGVVCSDLTISGDVGANNGLVTISGNYFSGFSNPAAASTAVEIDHTIANWTAAETTYFNILDMATRTLDSDDNATQTFILRSFNLNITNGVTRFGFDSNGDAEGYAFSEYAITGDLTIKYDNEFNYQAGENVLQDFLDGDTLTLNMIIGDGTHSSDGEMEITAEIQYTGDPALDMGEGGLYHTLPFECVDDGTFGLKTEVFKNEAVTVW